LLFAHADIAALKLIVFGFNPHFPIRCNRASAFSLVSRSLVYDQALMTILYVTRSGSTRWFELDSCCIISNIRSANWAALEGFCILSASIIIIYVWASGKIWGAKLSIRFNMFSVVIKGGSFDTVVSDCVSKTKKCHELTVRSSQAVSHLRLQLWFHVILHSRFCLSTREPIDRESSKTHRLTPLSLD
jgi:hypothetical protein